MGLALMPRMTAPKFRERERNAERSRERLEVLQEISYVIYEGVRLTLERLIPGKQWDCQWYADRDGLFDPRGSVMSFRWSDSFRQGNWTLPFHPECLKTRK